jgi:hypothetical protein
MNKINTFITNVAGVTYRNNNWSSRQSNIRKYCVIGDEVNLAPEPNNEFDSNAIKVTLRNNEQIGYLSSDIIRAFKRRQKKKENLKQRAFINRVDSFVDEQYKDIWFVELIVIEWDASTIDYQDINQIIFDMNLNAKTENFSAYEENFEFASNIAIDLTRNITTVNQKLFSTTWKAIKFLTIETKKLIVRIS